MGRGTSRSARLGAAAAASILLAGCSSEDVGTNDFAVTVCGKTSVKGIDGSRRSNAGWGALAALALIASVRRGAHRVKRTSWKTGVPTRMSRDPKRS